MNEKSPFGWFKDISIAKKLYFTVGIMALLIALELFTLMFSIHTLSSVRAYVGGEGLWSKGEKDAIFQLLKYGIGHNEEDYLEFKEYIKTPLGDGKTLAELSKPNPDLEIAKQGFIEGRNHPDDVDGMIKLFSRFNRISYIKKAITIWAEANPIPFQLTAIGDSLHQEINSPHPSQEKINQLLGQITPINKKVTVLEDDFSFTLSEGARWLEGLVLKLLFVIALTVEITGLLLAISVSRGIQKGLTEIISASAAFAKGKLSTRAKVYSKDEIGVLADSFNQMSAKFEKSTSDLELKNKELEQFAYVASHDMQEPLRSISGFVELLDKQHGQGYNATEKQYMGYIVDSTHRMESQIKALLDYSRIGRNPVLQKVDCNELLKEVQDDLDASIREKNAVIEIKNLPVLSAYPLELKQLFMNLIGNALKFVSPGVKPLIKIAAQKTENGWKFTVKDNGIGINKKYHEKIFVIFQRLHNRKDYEGTGIGLAHCKKIAELHHGTIGLESEENKGSTFYFTIPG